MHLPEPTSLSHMPNELGSTLAFRQSETCGTLTGGDSASGVSLVSAVYRFTFCTLHPAEMAGGERAIYAKANSRFTVITPQCLNKLLSSVTQPM